MNLNLNNVQDILLISLSNLGDVILSFPVIDILKRDFPTARLSIVVGPKAESFFAGNPHIDQVYVFNKHSSNLQKIQWIRELRKKHFDLVIDLRNSAIPFMIRARKRTLPNIANSSSQHMKIKHLNHLKSIVPFETESEKRYALFISQEDTRSIDRILKKELAQDQKIFIISPGAANHIKRWEKDGFVSVCDHLVATYRCNIIFIGDHNDAQISAQIQSAMRHPSLNLCGQTTLTQLADLLSRSVLALVNDSAVMHLASYLRVPVVAIFGPTDPKKYGPWGNSRHIVVQKDIFCSPCERASCLYQHECMKLLEPLDVIHAIEKIMKCS